MSNAQGTATSTHYPLLEGLKVRILQQISAHYLILPESHNEVMVRKKYSQIHYKGNTFIRPTKNTRTKQCATSCILQSSSLPIKELVSKDLRHDWVISFCVPRYGETTIVVFLVLSKMQN